jgi:hypothetical protein
MRFLCIYKPSKPESAGPTAEDIALMTQFVTEGIQAGWLISTEGCLPSALGARVRMTGTNFTVTDGPFAETKELIGGFALIQADSKAHAIELTKRFLQIAGDGETEIRQIYGPPPDSL